MFSNSEKVICSELATACRILDMEEQTDVNHGQVSCRSSVPGRYVIRGAALGFDEIDESSFAVVNDAGERLEGSVAIPPEWPIHASIYKRRPDVRSIVHTHPIHAIAFSSTGEPLRPVSHDACPFMPDLHIFGHTTNTITDWKTAEILTDGLGGGAGALLQNHGIVTVGKTIKRATILAIMLERACQIQLKLPKEKLKLCSSDQDVDDKNRFIFSDVSVSTYWAYYKRKLERQAQEMSGQLMRASHG